MPIALQGPEEDDRDFMIRVLEWTGEGIRESKDYVKYLMIKHKYALEEKDETIKKLTQELKEQKHMNERLRDQKDAAHRRYQQLIQGWSALYKKDKREWKPATATSEEGARPRSEIPNAHRGRHRSQRQRC